MNTFRAYRISLATAWPQAQRTHINMLSLYEDLKEGKLNTQKLQSGEICTKSSSYFNQISNDDPSLETSTTVSD